MKIYYGDRSCLELYDGIKCIDDVIQRLEDQLDEFRRMKAAGVDAYSADDDWEEDGALWLYAEDPKTVENFDFWEAGDLIDEATCTHHFHDEFGKPLCQYEGPRA